MVRHHLTPARVGAGAGAPVQAVAFALSGGAAIDAGALIHVDPVAGKGCRLLLCVEPLEPSERGLELASLALTTLRETFVAAELPPAAALMKAFTAANAVLIKENRPLAGCRWERRVYVGATGMVLSGRELIIAQVPPTATMIVQDGRLYAFPELASWRQDYVPPTDEPEPDPLGCREGTRPFLFRTTAAAGDLVTFCSTTIARHVGAANEANVAALLSGNPESTLDFLGDLAAAHELDNAHAAAIHLRRLSPERHFPRLSLPGGRRRQATWPVMAPRLPSPQRVGFLALGGADLPPGRPAYAVRTDWGAVGVPLDRPLATAAGPNNPAGRSRHFTLSLAQARRDLVGLLHHLWHRPPASTVPLVGLGPRRRDLAAPGVRSVRRYRDEPSFPVEWRTHLPRGPEVHLPTRMFAVGLVLFLTFGGSGALLDRYRAEIARADAALATVDGSVQAIIADPGAAATALATAEAALAEARAAGADADTIQRQALAVEAARDLAWGNIRLHSLTRLGSLPPSLRGNEVQLARTGDAIWLIGEALYGVDAERQRLVQVLGPGMAVPGGEVHAMRAGVSDGGRLTVLDDTALYQRDETGRWQRHFLSPDAREATAGAVPLATYQRSLYALGANGELLKLPADDFSGTPEVWVSAAEYPDLLSGADLVIDGKIHVLLADGRILTFYRGALETVRTTEVTPALASARRMVGGPDTNFLYVHDPRAEIGPTTGRIVRLDPAGNTVQILPPLPARTDSGPVAGAHVLATADDLLVDEANGFIYLLTETELWRASLPR